MMNRLRLLGCFMTMGLAVACAASGGLAERKADSGSTAGGGNAGGAGGAIGKDAGAAGAEAGGSAAAGAGGVNGLDAGGDSSTGGSAAGGSGGSSTGGAGGAGGCPTGQTACPPNGCIDLTSDVHNCAVCANACALGTACINSACGRPPPLPAALTRFASVLGPDGQVYLLGGTTTFGSMSLATPLKTVYVYSPKTNQWGTAPSMLTPRMDFAAVVGKDGRIYAIGGTSSTGGSMTSVEAYDLSTKTWTAAPSMQIGRSHLAAALGGDGRIYAIEGLSQTSGQGTLSVEALNTTTGIWSSAASLDVVGSLFGTYEAPIAVPYQGRIYLFIDDVSATVSDLRVYDPITNLWSDGPPLSTDAPITAWAMDGDLFIIDSNSEIFAYDPANSQYVTSKLGGKISSISNGLGAVVGPLDHGRVLAAGGIYEYPSTQVYLFDPSAGMWIGAS